MSNKITAYIVDRRQTMKGIKGVSNRAKFLKRVKKHVKRQVKEFIASDNVTDIVNNTNRKVNISPSEVDEPFFVHNPERGVKDFVIPGNDRFERGDKIPKPPSGGSGGSGDGAGESGEGESDFSFVLTKEEFMEYFFEDLELPNLVKKDLATQEDFEMRRSGFSASGSPSRLDFLQSMKQSVGRRVALRNPKKKKIKQLEAEIENLREEMNTAASGTSNQEALQALIDDKLEEIKVLKRKLKAVTYVDDTDLRYRQYVKEPQPIFSAAMICLMDVSGSMDEMKQDLAKRFFMLLYLFLYKNYETVEIRFVRYHTTAREVDEHEFFYARDTGGTMCSSGIKEVSNILNDYPADRWNIYIAHASDGDNWPGDNEAFVKILTEQVLPRVQEYFYVELGDTPGMELSEAFASTNSSKVHSRSVSAPNEIYPVFRSFFEGDL